MYQALYRKWRPKRFIDIIGQTHITDILRSQCISGKTSHAYLFCGSRGTGKTTAAKILAKSVNCLAPENGDPCGKCENCIGFDSGNATDVLEIDAASNNGVDNIRDLRDEVAYPPSTMKKRVYIIDEVHMLSTGAFNALLKTLEEPPEYVIFILATTELNKIPPTVLSRCQRFEFRRIQPDMISSRISAIAKEEKISITDDAVRLIANLSDGAMRDALSLLESCASSTEGSVLDAEVVEQRLGVTDNNSVISLYEGIASGNASEALEIISRIHSGAKDLSSFLEDVTYFTRDLIFAHSSETNDIEISGSRFYYTANDSKRIKDILKAIPREKLFCFADILSDAVAKLSRYSLNKRIYSELTVLKLCNLRLFDDPTSLAARLYDAEERIKALELSASAKPAPKAQKKKENVDPDEDDGQISLL